MPCFGFDSYLCSYATENLKKGELLCQFEYINARLKALLPEIDKHVLQYLKGKRKVNLYTRQQ